MPGGKQVCVLGSHATAFPCGSSMMLGMHGACPRTVHGGGGYCKTYVPFEKSKSPVSIPPDLSKVSLVPYGGIKVRS